MAEDKKANTALVAGASGLVGAALAILASRRAEAAPPIGEVTLDEATMLLLQSIAQSGDNIDFNTAETVEAIKALAAALGVSILKNPNQIVCFRVLVPVVGTPIQFPGYPVPFNHDLVIKAQPANLGIMYIGNSEADARNPNSSWWLLANEAIEYKIENSEQLWVNASRANEGVLCTVEQRRG